MPFAPTLWHVLARDKGLDTGTETMAAAMLALGWTERRPGVWGVGDDDQESSPSDLAICHAAGMPDSAT